MVDVLVSFDKQKENPFLIGKNTFRNMICKELGVLPVAKKVSVKYRKEHGKNNYVATLIFHFAYIASAEKIAAKAKEKLTKNVRIVAA